MKKVGTIFAIILLGVLGIFFFAQRKDSADTLSVIDKEDGFFIWMDGYMALPIDSEFDVALTYYYFADKENYIHKEDISAVAFEGVSNIRVSNFQVRDVECENKAYGGYAIQLTVQTLKEGVEFAEAVRVQVADGTQYVCRLGEWCFDVDAEDAGYVDAYSSTFATSSEDKFRYKYLMDDSYSIAELQYWKDKIVTENVPTEDTIIMEGDAPFRYIKSKGLVEAGGEQYRFYGLGSYCGILISEDQDIELSYNHNKQTQ